MNDEFFRRSPAEADPQPDFGFGGAPLFRDEVYPAVGPEPDGAEYDAAYNAAYDTHQGFEPGSGFGMPGPAGYEGYGEQDGLFEAAEYTASMGPGDPGEPYAGGEPGEPAQPQWGPNEGPLRVVKPEHASALLRIRLPERPPVPATTLRGDAPIERMQEAAQMLHTNASPARPTSLPGDVLALTTATMVVPMPTALAGAGVRGVGAVGGTRLGTRETRRPALLTASVPPDLASRAEADLLTDTVEQFFDFDAIGRELDASREEEAAAEAQAPAAPTGPARYGVPTQFPGYDAARRSPVGMRYLGGIFHDSSGESSFYDPATESLVPLGSGAFSAAEFRRTPSAVARSVPVPRRERESEAVPLPRAAVEESEHWEHHHPDHHRTRRTGRRRGRVVLVSALAAGLAFGGMYGVALAFEGQVPKGTVVDGVAIGGMTRLAAEARLADTLGPVLMAPIQLVAGGSSAELSPDQAGLTVDYAATVAAAAVGRSDPMVAIPALLGRGRTAVLKVTVDRALLRAALVKATAALDRPMIDGGVTFSGGVPTPIAPRPGSQVDLDAAVDAVASAFGVGAASVGQAAALPGSVIVPVGYAVPMAATPPGSSAIPPVVLSVHDIQPTVTPATVAQAIQDLARPAMSGPITVITGTIKTTLKPQVLGRYLSLVPDGHGGLVPRLDGQGLRGEIDHEGLAKLEQPATDAGFTVTAGKPVLIPGKLGTGYAPEAIQNAVIPVLTKTQAAQRTATVPLGPLPPQLTTEAAEVLGVRDVMGTYTAPFTANTNRAANVHRAADLVRGRILQPGQTFSLNQILGARSTADGFIPAANTTDTAAPAQDAGAGTSLVATALFNAEYLAGLKDVEHHPHATLTDKFPAGMEAAVSFPDVDLKFTNDSGAPIYLWTSTADTSITVAILGRKPYDTVQTEVSPHYAIIQPKVTTSASSSCVAQDGTAGFQIDVTRILTKNGQEPIRQVFHSSYAPQDKLVCTSQTAGGASASQGSTGSGPTTAPGQVSGGAAGGATAGGGTSTGGTPTSPPTSPPTGWDGSLLGGLLAPPSRR